MDNYRPISVLPVASKLLERSVHWQRYEFLSEHQLLRPYQCGFRKSHSTESATISFTDSIRRRMGQGLLTGAVFVIDLQKAFDAVDHCVKLSDLCPITSGLPQGSILGPLLFVLLVNDLPLATNRCSTLMYADDRVLYYADRDVEVIEKTLNEDLSYIDNWLRNNSLFLDKEKTECILWLSSVNSFTVSVKGRKKLSTSQNKSTSLLYWTNLFRRMPM